MNLITKMLVGAFTVIILSGTVLGIYFGVFYEQNIEPEEVVLSLQGSTSTNNYTLTDLKAFQSVSGNAGYRKSTGTLSGLNQYKGVLVQDLVDDIGGISASEELQIIAGDQYSITFTIEMISGRFPAYNDITGEYLGLEDFRVILAYEMDGQKLPSSDGILRLACLPKEGESYLSDSSLWVKDVQILKIITSTSWIVNLDGAINDSIDRSTFEAFMLMNNEANLLVYQIQENDRFNTYEGLALWRIIGLFDDEDSYSFNETLASNGYTIILKNALNESVLIDSAKISLNDSFILAAKKNTAFLSGSDAPLIFVGPGVLEIEMIRGINYIKIDF